MPRPLPEDFDDTCTMVKGLLPMLVDLEDVQATVARLMREDCTQKQIVNTLIQCRKVSTKRLLAALVESLAVTTNTPKNRARWLRRFQDGLVPYICPDPDCGFSGDNKDFKFMDSSCGVCPNGHLNHPKTFEQSWEPGEYEAYRAELDKQDALKKAQKAIEVQKDAEIRKRVDSIVEAVMSFRPERQVRDLWEAVDRLIKEGRPGIDDEEIVGLWWPLYDHFDDSYEGDFLEDVDHWQIAGTILDKRNNVESLKRLVMSYYIKQGQEESQKSTQVEAQ
jgi:hypothetical protein